MERTSLLLGEEKLERLQQAHVLVVGLGGVGAYAAEMLVRAGIGRMTIADADVVSLSNINRQLVALHSTIGRLKADILAERLRDIAPDLQLTSSPSSSEVRSIHAGIIFVRIVFGSFPMYLLSVRRLSVRAIPPLGRRFP